jgi:hypothetical protein
VGESDSPDPKLIDCVYAAFRNFAPAMQKTL